MQSITLRYPLAFPEAGIPAGGQVLAIGDFDGLHLGHREVIQKAVDIAKQKRLPAAIMTFHPHPRDVLGRGEGKYGLYITPLERKLELFAQAGIEVAYIVDFDLDFARIAAAQFVEDVLVKLQAQTVVVGFDFRFGHLGAGDPESLRQMAAGRFDVEVVQPFHMTGEKVSSTLIRDCLEQGDLLRVKQLLGRHFALTGTVVHGAARGRQIGFPTANIELDGPYVVPCNGVYAVRLQWAGQSYNGVMNIGTKPTFEGDSTRRTLEAHLFDFSQSIYGEYVTVELISYIRPERKFNSIDELIAQIGRDVNTAKKQLGYPLLNANADSH